MENTFEIGQEVKIKTKNNEFQPSTLLVNKIDDDIMIECLCITNDGTVSNVRINRTILAPVNPTNFNEIGVPVG
jgi:hypothetical protein